MKLNFVTQIQSGKKGNFNSFSKLYPTPVQQQAIESFTNAFLPGKQPKRSVPKLQLKPVDTKSLDEMVKAQQGNVLYDGAQFDLQRFLTKTMEEDERRLQEALAQLKRSDLNFESEVRREPRRLARAHTRALTMIHRLSQSVPTHQMDEQAILQRQNDIKYNIEGKYCLPTPIKLYNFHERPTVDNTIVQESQKQLRMNSQPSQSSQPGKFDSLIKIEYKDYGYEIYQEQKMLNSIINNALKTKVDKEKPQNASLSIKLKRVQMRKYLNHEFENSVAKAQERSYTTVERKPRHKRQKRLNKMLNYNSQNNMLKSFVERMPLRTNQSAEILDKSNEVFLKCYKYLTES